MMGVNKEQSELFSYYVNLDKRVRADHPLRAVRNGIDFAFVRDEVSACYGHNGNVSVDPVVVMKMFFLLFFDDVASERELMKIIPERLDYLWFLGYGLDDSIPDHSVLSKARRRWGTPVFESLFLRIVGQCVDEGLVDGEKIHMDGSLIDANASKNAVRKGSPELIAALKEVFDAESAKFDEPEDEENSEDPLQPSKAKPSYYERKNKALVNKTDPDAPMVRKGKGDTRARYKNHRVVDDRKGVITATETTQGDVEENAKLMELVQQHESNTGATVRTVIADTQYGTTDNFRSCNERNIRSHMGDLLASQGNKGRRGGIFGAEDFAYDPQTDTYRCPAGEILTRRKHRRKRKAYEYSCPRSVCAACTLRDQCTRAKNGAPRTIKRHINQQAIDRGRTQSRSPAAKRDRIRRKWLMEGSFADAANNHGFKRARWRRIDKQQIQGYLIAAIQNARILIRNARLQKKAAAAALRIPYSATKEAPILPNGTPSGPPMAYASST